MNYTTEPSGRVRVRVVRVRVTHDVLRLLQSTPDGAAPTAGHKSAMSLATDVVAAYAGCSTLDAMARYGDLVAALVDSTWPDSDDIPYGITAASFFEALVARGNLIGAEPMGASSDWTVRMLVCNSLLAAPASEPT
jgi:hypothetical protein